MQSANSHFLRRSRTDAAFAQASLEIGDIQAEKATQPDDKAAVFEANLKAGKQTLKTLFFDAEGEELCSANYVRVTKL
jgi:hypothetical protein